MTLSEIPEVPDEGAGYDLNELMRPIVAERDAAVAAVATAHTNHIKEPHLDEHGRERRTGLHDPDCSACRAFVALSAAMPSRPDDPEEIRRLAQATTEETNDG